MIGQSFLLFSLLFSQQAFAQIVAYEGTDCFPESCTPSWTRFGTFDSTRWLQDGRMYDLVQLGSWPRPYGQEDIYQCSISQFAFAASFFLEWRIQTDAPSTDIDGQPVVVAAFGNGSGNYHFDITNGRLRFTLGNPLQLTLFVDFAPGVEHTFRLEIRNTHDYTWYIDDALFNSGTSNGSYPTSSSKLNWSTSRYQNDQTTIWDYIRSGFIPADHSGDFDSNSVVDQKDLYYFVDCLLGPGGAWPGCTWADMNSDGVANGADIPAFVAAMIT